LQVTQKKLLIFTNQFLAVSLPCCSALGEGQQIPGSVKDKIMHVSLPIGKNNVLMGTDACEEMGFNVTQGNNFYICISPDSKEEADKLFNALGEGGKINTPLQNMFWGAYYGDLTDKFGIKWMVNYQKQ
jgi:PhnB protein